MRRILAGYVSIGWGLMATVTGLTAPAGAQTSEVVISRSFVRATGTPVTATDTFPACDPAGRFTLVIDNGPGGQPKVTSGTVTINGLEVVHDSDFKQQLPHLERSLSGIAAANRLDVRLGSQPGGTVALAVVAVQSCIRITGPAPGSPVVGPVTVVRGTVPASSGGDIGVTVNEMPAFVEAGQFVALVPVDASVSQLTVTARNFSGATLAQHTIAVVGQAGSPIVTLEAIPGGGLSPLTVGFRLSAGVGVAGLTLDANGDGVPEIQGTTLLGQTVTYPRPGVYTPQVLLTDPQGRVYSASTVVHVYDRGPLDARLQAVWQGLQDALRVGDVNRALTFVHSDTRESYRDLLTQMSSYSLANIDQAMTTIRLVEVGFAGAKYEMERPRGSQVQRFSVWFMLDVDGLWRLRRF